MVGSPRSAPTALSTFQLATLGCFSPSSSPLPLPCASTWCPSSASSARPQRRPRCAYFRSPRYAGADGGFRVDVKADYDGIRIPVARGASIAVDADRRRLIERDPDAESTGLNLLSELGARPLVSYPPANSGAEFSMAVKRFPVAVRALVAAGWQVRADDKQVHQPLELKFRVQSGIDWFELHADVQFGGHPSPFRSCYPPCGAESTIVPRRRQLGNSRGMAQL